MENEGKKEVEKVEYNLSGFKINHIAKLIEQADYYFMQGHIDLAFRRWKCVYSHIYSRLNLKERNKCKVLEVKFTKRPEVDKKMLQKYLCFFYEEYTLHLQGLLKRYGFDLKERESSDYYV